MLTVVDPDQFRNKIVGKYMNLLKNHVLAKNLEIGVFNYTINASKVKKIVKKWDNSYFVQIYIDRTRTLFYNLTNKKLLKSIINYEIKPQQLANMTHQEMDMDKWKNMIEKKKQRDKSKTEERMIEGAFKCKKCGSEKTSYYQMQTRSADEPMTTFVQCECGNRWKC
jgi:transcription elongation factor S-II